MISGLDSNSELFLAAIARVQRRMAEANLQVSSGKRVTVASDAPDEISSLLRLKADQRHTARLESNLGMAKTDADTADTTMTASIRLMDRALALGAQGANGAMDADKRQMLAQEVASLQEQMQANSRALTVPATFRIEDPAGSSFAAAKTTAEIFDPVFTALDNLRLALASNDVTAVTGAIDSVKTASGHLNSMQAFYGTVQNRIQAASDFAARHDVDLKTGISRIEDADLTTAALEMTQGNTQLQAAFQMRAKVPRTSLFDFLG